MYDADDHDSDRTQVLVVVMMRSAMMMMVMKEISKNQELQKRNMKLS